MTTSVPCTRATPSTASCTSRARCRYPTAAAVYSSCGLWSTRSASLTSRYWTGALLLCSSEHNELVTPLAVPDAVLSRARRVADGFRPLTGAEVDADVIIAGRAGLLGHSPHGRISAGGVTRLMQSRDGWCALTLSRPDDVDAVPALIQVDAVGARPLAGGAALGRRTRLRRSDRTRAVARPSSGRARRDVCRTTARPPPRGGHDAAQPVRSCWSPTCRRCGRARCAGSCWRRPAPSS